MQQSMPGSGQGELRGENAKWLGRLSRTVQWLAYVVIEGLRKIEKTRFEKTRTIAGLRVAADTGLKTSW